MAHKGKETRPAIPGTVVALAAVLGTALIGASVSLAYERYYPGCITCHGDFDTDVSPKGTVFPNDNKHSMHNSNQWMNADCALCHVSNGDNPKLGSSGGTDNNAGVGCVGCHGRQMDAGNDSWVPGSPPDMDGLPNSPGRGAGLRQHHTTAGETDCAGCHMDADPANYTPVGEGISPQYYGVAADSSVDEPCNPTATAKTNENWTAEDPGEFVGLDNDGDGLYDGADPDCQPGDPDINLDPTTLTFGTTTLTSTRSRATQIQNVGTKTLQVTSIALCSGTSSEFSWSPSPPFTVPIAGQQQLTVSYSPADVGQDGGCLSIGSDDPDENPIELTVSGEGVACVADRVFTGVVDQVEEEVACSSITLGPNLQIVSGAFRAGEVVVFANDVEAQDATISIDVALIPLP